MKISFIIVVLFGVLCQQAVCSSSSNSSDSRVVETKNSTIATSIRGRCVPKYLTCVDRYDKKCRGSKYRTIDGSCNNLFNWAYGKSFTTYRRLIPAAYSDGIFALPVARNGEDLPSARKLSHKIFGRDVIDDPVLTLMAMQFGQVVTHDQSIRLPNGFPGLDAQDTITQRCCSGTGRYEIRNDTTRCFPIPVSWNDPHFRNRECIDFGRSVTDKDQKCRGTEGSTPAEQLNGVTHFLDLSLVYGSTNEHAKAIRAFKDGYLLTNDYKRLWPPRFEDPIPVCNLGQINGICYLVGDIRGNQNPGLAMLQIILFREHNRLARGLSKVNPHWDDETLYQEARRINIAQYQYITYHEWLPRFIGRSRMRDAGLIFKTYRGECINDYDPCVDPRSVQSFEHSAFRFLHSMVMGKLLLYTESRKLKHQSLRLGEFLDRPGILEEKNELNSLIRGHTTQHSALPGINFDFEISDNFILGVSVGLRGRDLRSYDIQRDRDHGLPRYNEFRQYCGLKKARSWMDYSDVISEKDIYRLQKIYDHFEDVDLSVGGALERPEHESVFGPTFHCITIQHFLGSRKGDRYFFENGDQPHPFTSDQLEEIRNANFARILCDNSGVDTMQPFAFKTVSDKNPLVDCWKLKSIDLDKWKDDYQKPY